MALITIFVGAVLWGIWEGGGLWAVGGALVAVAATEFLVLRSIKSRRNFRTLDALEQALRRASQGFAVMVSAVLAAVIPYVWLNGWRSFAALFPWMIEHPADAWPVAVPITVFVAGFVRFIAGARLALGARDGIRRALALVKLAIGLVIVGYLTLAYPWSPLGATAAGFFGLVLIYSVGLWCALVGGMRFALLVMPVRGAIDIVEDFGGRTGFQWPEQRRRWWQFWRR